jgi:transposase
MAASRRSFSSSNAGWRSEAGLNLPEGARIVFLPPYTPELQPAETLWTLVDERIINKHATDIEELNDIIAARCVTLANRRAEFHWWPKIANTN